MVTNQFMVYRPPNPNNLNLLVAETTTCFKATIKTKGLDIKTKDLKA